MWKRAILIMALLASTAMGITDTGRGPNYDSQFWTYSTGAGYNWMKDVQELVEAGVALGTGSVFYVDSNVSIEGDGTSWDKAKDTLDEAINLCTASQGDFILVAQGHREAMGAAADEVDLDVIGVTVIGMGSGTVAPIFDWEGDVTGAFAIGATNVSIYNLRFETSITEANDCIDIEAGGDYATVSHCQFAEGAASASEFLNCIDLASGADYVTISNCTARSADAAGAVSWIDLTAGVNNGVKILNNDVYGDYSTAIIYSNKADLEILVRGGVYTNANADEFVIEFSGNSTGWISDILCGTDVYTTAVDPGLCVCDNDVVWFDTDAGANATAAPMFTLAATGAWSFDLGTNNLDHLLKTVVADDSGAINLTEVVDKTVLSWILAGDGDTESFVPSTDALSVLSDNIALILADTTLIVEDTGAADASSEIALLVDPNNILHDAPRIVSCTTAAMDNAIYNSGTEIIFDVNGTIMARCVAVVTTTCTSASNNGTVELGVAGDTGCMLGQQVLDGTAFVENDVWTLAQDADTPSADLTTWTIVPNSLDLILTTATNNPTAGVIVFYLEWLPLSPGATCTANAQE